MSEGGWGGEKGEGSRKGQGCRVSSAEMERLFVREKSVLIVAERTTAATDTLEMMEIDYLFLFFSFSASFFLFMMLWSTRLPGDIPQV